MIVLTPQGAPELACDECGCRYFDRMSNCCYECSAPISAESIAEYQAALQEFLAANGERGEE